MFFNLARVSDLYRVASSNDLEENSIFHIAKNIFIDVDTEELNDVLSSSEYTQVNEDDIDKSTSKIAIEMRTSQLMMKKRILINFHDKNV